MINLYLSYILKIQPIRAALHERPSQAWGQWKPKWSLVIGPKSEIGLRGLIWEVKAHFSKQFFNAWETRSDTARVPKIGRYKNGRPFHGVEVVSKNP